MDETSAPPGSAQLTGWKEIAAYLGRSVRAVQRYERDLGLPVHRLRTADGQTVYAFRPEIDAWRERLDGPQKAHDADRAQARPPAGGGQKFWLGAGAAAALLVVAFLFRGAISPVSRARPQEIRYLGRAIEAVDRSGHVVWSYQFEGQTSGSPYAGVRPVIRDLDDDGAAEAIVPTRHGPVNSKVTTSDGVSVFSPEGTLLWTTTPDATVTCGPDSFTGPWELRAIAVSADQHDGTFWLAFVHHTWRPSFVVEVHADGSSLVRYVQSGWIVSLGHWPTPAGRLLVAGGVMNEQATASVVIIDPEGPPAGSPAAEERNRCSENSTEAVQRVLIFPTLETTRPLQAYDFIGHIRTVGPDLKVSYQNGHALALLRPDLELADYALADSYPVVHRNLERAGLISHPAAECPFATTEQEILEWSRLDGWHSLYVRPSPY